MTNYLKVFSVISVCVLASCSATKGREELDMSKDFQEYQELRLSKGHFQGGKWNSDVDDWNGRKHQLMTKLAEYAIDQDWDADELKKHFGEPDEKILPGSELFDQIARHGQNKELLKSGNEFAFYHWRGTHDFLIFVLNDQHVNGYDWWYPRE